jgi:hypothetical protein
MSALFDPGREGFLDGSIDWDTDDVRCMLVKDTYAFDAADKFLSDLGAIDNGRSAALGTKTVTNGVADAADSSLVATAAVSCNALVIFKQTGDDATARVVGYIGVAAFTPSAGQTINITFDAGANKIFKL